MSGSPPRRWFRHAAAQVALLPLAATVLLAYLGTVAWSARVSFSSSRSLPIDDFAGFTQYARLFSSERWLLSLQNMLLFGAMFIVASLVIGFLLAVFLDQRVKGEGVLRTALLYPYAMSFVATGLVWQWILNPELGLQSTLRNLGFANAQVDWIVRDSTVMVAVAVAAVWQASGLVMALMLAGMRGIDGTLWKAARIDGIPPWRVYLSIVLPMMGPALGTATVLLMVNVVKLFDLVVTMTQGGPGLASEVPAKFIIDHMFERANIGLASAASMQLLLTLAALLAPWMYVRHRAGQRSARVHRTVSAATEATH